MEHKSCVGEWGFQSFREKAPHPFLSSFAQVSMGIDQSRLAFSLKDGMKDELFGIASWSLSPFSGGMPEFKHSHHPLCINSATFS